MRMGVGVRLRGMTNAASRRCVFESEFNSAGSSSSSAAKVRRPARDPLGTLARFAPKKLGVSLLEGLI
jgi:hypothetical protein